MSEQVMGGAAPHTLSVADLWALQTYDLTIAHGPGDRPLVMQLRRLDLMTRLLEDTVNAPLLQASMAIIKEVQDWIAEGQDRTFESAFQNLSAEKKRTVLEQLAHNACKVVLAPKLTLDPAAEPDAFPVMLLGASILFDIWNHIPSGATVPGLSEVAAATFRPEPGAGADQPASDGQGVRPAAVGLAADAGAAQ